MSFEYQNNLSDLMEYLKQRLLGNQNGSQNVSFKNYSKRRLKYIKGKTGNSGPTSGQARRWVQITPFKLMGSPIKVLRTFCSFPRSLEKVCIISKKTYQKSSILLKEKVIFSLADSEGQKVFRGPNSILIHLGMPKEGSGQLYIPFELFKPIQAHSPFRRKSANGHIYQL